MSLPKGRNLEEDVRSGAWSPLKALAICVIGFNPLVGWKASGALHSHNFVMKRPAARSQVLVLMHQSQPFPKKAPGRSTMRVATSIVSKRFLQGDWWVWLYRDSSGQPSCWERYSVRATGPDADLIIDMASRFSDDEEYFTHHRMRLSLGDCLAATDDHKGWRFNGFAFVKDGVWCNAPQRDNVQAFEEKFNAFLMGSTFYPQAKITKTRQREVSALGRATLVQTQRHNYTASWYVREPQRYAGVAAFKTFGSERSTSTFTFELIGMGNDLIQHAGGLSLETDGRSPFDI